MEEVWEEEQQEEEKEQDGVGAVDDRVEEVEDKIKVTQILPFMLLSVVAVIIV